MLDFGKHIKELLLLNDCVILPGLGGFVANYRPAEFDRVRNTASPPSKHILFNRQLVHNDGLLFAHVSKAEGYGYMDVENMARNYLEGIQKDTRKGMKFNIGGLGYFYADSEGQIQFTEEAGNNFLLESYGLPLLQYREFEKKTIPESYRSVGAEINPAVRQARIRRWSYGVAAACLLTAMIIVPIDIPLTDKFQKEQALQTEAETSQAAVTVSQAGIVPGLSATPAIKSFLPDPEYHIVVGSFKDFGNARLLRSDLVDKGFQPRILCTEKGFYRVTAGTYTGEDEAIARLKSVYEHYDEAWVLSN
ncbi:MAG TPA: SPOR domain-containing protein [Bacteroides sp.]|nr:SPOR domain-containing protein [Bacteroides sp.]